MQGADKRITSRSSSASYLMSPLQPYLCYVPGDLQQELAYLRAHVFPHLDSLCEARGVCFRPLDIHYAQNNDENDEEHNFQPNEGIYSHVHQQLKISLDFISSSSSFLCLLGHHYGCFLPEERMSSPPGQPESEPSGLSEVMLNLLGALRGGYSWVMEESHRTCSLTELEIIQAAFRQKTRHCFFYFKDCTAKGDEDAQDDEDESEMLVHGLLCTQRERETKRMWEMKSRIINTCLPVRFFRDLQELDNLVKRDWESIIDKLYPAPEQETISGYREFYHESHIQALSHVSVPSRQTTEALELLNAFVFPVADMAKCKSHSNEPSLQCICKTAKREPERPILLLSGERGCGKSTLAARWLDNFRKQNPKVPVIPHFCGISTASKDVRSMLRLCTTELRKAFYGKLPEWMDGLEERVEARPLLGEVQAFTAAAHLGPCVLLLDGLDFLTDTLGLSLQKVKELTWLPAVLPSHCKLILTTTTTDLTYKILSSRSEVQVVTWPGLTDPCIQQSVLSRHLALPCKDLPALLKQRIMGKKLSCLPVFVAILGSELRTCGMQREEEEVEELMEEYLEVDSVSELWVKVIRRWVKDYSRPSVDPSSSGPEPNTVVLKLVSSLELRGWVWDTLCLIHVSRSGLSEAEILALLDDLGHSDPCRIQVLEWARLRSAFGPWVQEKPNGLLCFSHPSLSQAMELLLLGVVERQRSRCYFHRVLARFFQRSGGTVRDWLRRLEELPWHLEQTGAFQDLHSVLSHPATMAFMSSAWRQYPQLRLNVVHYWAKLSQRGYDPASSLQRLLVHSGCGLPDLGIVGKTALLSSDILLSLDKNKDAEDILLIAETTIQQAEELDGDGVRALLEVQHTLAQLYIHLQQVEEAVVYCTKGLETAHLLPAASPGSTADISLTKGHLLCSLCRLVLEEGRLDSATGILQEISSTGLLSTHPCAEGTVALLQGLHRIGLGEISVAEHYLQTALATRRRWYGSDHPLVAAVEEKLADIWADSIHTDKDQARRKAAEVYRHVIRVREAATGLQDMTAFLSQPLWRDLTSTLSRLGTVLAQSSCKAERREALSLLQRSSDLKHLLSPGHLLTRELKHVLNTGTIGVRKHVTTTAATGSRNCSTGVLLTKCSPLPQPSVDLSMTGSTPGLSRSALTVRATPQELKRNEDEPLSKPWMAFQTNVFGPQSDIRSLEVSVPRAGVRRPRCVVSGESLAQRPGPLHCHEHIEAVKALNRQMRTPIHRK